MATKLIEVRIIDKDYLMVHYVDGDVTFIDDGTGFCAFGNCHEQDKNYVTRYGPSLDTVNALDTNTWNITSDDDENYGSIGLHPAACYRKSKLNGMAENKWSGNDFIYDYTMEHFIYLKLSKPMLQGRKYYLTERLDSSNIFNARETSPYKSTYSFVYNIFNCISESIHINLAGYSTAPGIKSADLYLWMGDGGARDYSCNIGSKVFIYNVNTHQKTETGKVEFWKHNSTEAYHYNLIGCDVYTANFSSIIKPGKYRIAIEGVGCSQDFEIRGDIYYEPFKVSTMGYFYMRIGQDNMDISPVPRRPLYIPGKSPASTKVYITTMQPLHPQWKSFSHDDVWDNPDDWARFKKQGDPENPNAWGGHADAFDWDRGIQHISNIYDMLLPFFLTDGAIKDDNLDIAESGNGIPDIIDEARYEVDYWLRVRDGKGYSYGLTNPNQNNILYQAGTNAFAAWANAANCAMLSNCFQLAGLGKLSSIYRDSAIAAFNYADGLPDPLLDYNEEIGSTKIRGRDLKMMAAAYLYNVTGITKYETIVNEESNAKSDTSVIINSDTSVILNKYVNQLWGTAAYLKTKQKIHYPNLYSHMKASIIREAKLREVNFSFCRPSRRSADNNTGRFQTEQDVQRTIVAHAICDNPSDKQLFENALILEADWSLGRNPLNMIQMTTSTTSLDSKRSVENMFTSGRDDGCPGLDPGHTPYLNFDDWYCGNIMGCPSWLTSKCYPKFSQWPHAEGYFNTRYVWAHSEFTPQEIMRGKAALYGYLYGIGENSKSGRGLWLTVKAENGSIFLNADKKFYKRGEKVVLTAKPIDGYIFTGWGMNAFGTDNPLTITMNGNKIVTAFFTKNQ